MANEIDPLIRGIYYMYLNDKEPEFIDDVVSTCELIKICNLKYHGNWTISLHKEREIFVKELVKRNGN